MATSKLEKTIERQIADAGLPQPQRQYRFLAERHWRFDFAWPEYQLALEVEGGQWIRGRHNRGRGFEGDCEKYNAAALEGWTVLRATTDMVSDTRALELMIHAFVIIRASEGE